MIVQRKHKMSSIARRSIIGIAITLLVIGISGVVLAVTLGGAFKKPSTGSTTTPVVNPPVNSPVNPPVTPTKGTGTGYCGKTAGGWSDFPSKGCDRCSVDADCTDLVYAFCKKALPLDAQGLPHGCAS